MKRLIVITALSANSILNAQVKTTTVSGATNKSITPVAEFDTLAAPTDRTSVNPPPEHIKTKFITDYPGTSSVSWKMKGKHYVVTYTDPKTLLGHIIAYNKDGKIIQKEDEVNNLNFPKAIYENYTKRYPGENYFKVWKIENKPDEKYYYIFRDGKVLWFDKNGNYVPDNKIKSSNVSTYSFDLK